MRTLRLVPPRNNDGDDARLGAVFVIVGQERSQFDYTMTRSLERFLCNTSLGRNSSGLIYMTACALERIPCRRLLRTNSSSSSYMFRIGLHDDARLGAVRVPEVVGHEQFPLEQLHLAEHLAVGRALADGGRRGPGGRRPVARVHLVPRPVSQSPTVVAAVRRRRRRRPTHTAPDRQQGVGDVIGVDVDEHVRHERAVATADDDRALVVRDVHARDVGVHVDARHAVVVGDADGEQVAPPGVQRHAAAEREAARRRRRRAGNALHVGAAAHVEHVRVVVDADADVRREDDAVERRRWRQEVLDELAHDAVVHVEDHEVVAVVVATSLRRRAPLLREQHQDRVHRLRVRPDVQDAAHAHDVAHVVVAVRSHRDRAVEVDGDDRRFDEVAESLVEAGGAHRHQELVVRRHERRRQHERKRRLEAVLVERAVGEPEERHVVGRVEGRMLLVDGHNGDAVAQRHRVSADGAELVDDATSGHVPDLVDEVDAGQLERDEGVLGVVRDGETPERTLVRQQVDQLPGAHVDDAEFVASVAAHERHGIVVGEPYLGDWSRE